MSNSTRFVPTELMEKLLSCESPFSWAMPDIDPSYIDDYLYSQMEKCDNIEEEHQFKWTRFNLHLLLGYELWHQMGDMVNAIEHVDMCWWELQQLMQSGCLEPLFTSIQAALWHVVLTTRAHLYLANKEIQQAAYTISWIQPVGLLTAAEKAGLLGIKAAMFKQYKPEGIKQALELATIASKIDPGQAEWHFVIANCLGRLRRLKRGFITDEEVEEMGHALSLQKDATYTCHLAQMEAISLRPHCPALKVRVAHGLLRLPDQTLTDASWTKQLLDEASVHIPNNSMLHHDLGRYYHKFMRDPIRAIESLQRAHKLDNFPAFLYLTSLLWKYCGELDLIAEISVALDKYTTRSNRAELLVYLGTAYLLLRDDWTTAVECFIKSLELDRTAKYMKRFYGFFWKGKINLLEIVTNELRIKTSGGETHTNVFCIFLKQIFYGIDQNLLKKPINPALYANFKHIQMAHKF